MRKSIQSNFLGLLLKGGQTWLVDRHGLLAQTFSVAKNNHFLPRLVDLVQWYRGLFDSNKGG